MVNFDEIYLRSVTNYAGLDGGVFLTQHLIGIKDARRGVAMFWCFNEFVGGAQLTCTIIANYLATLGDLSEKTCSLITVEGRTRTGWSCSG